MPSSLPVFLDEVPDYVVRDGRMYVSVGSFCMAMPINVFLIGCARGTAAVKLWQSERECSVVSFRGGLADKLGAS